MSFDGDPLERAYPYRIGLGVIGCTSAVFGMIGAFGLVLMPFGCDQVNNGNIMFGWAVIAGGLCTAPVILLALASVVVGVRDAVAPPLLRVTPTALILPDALRGEALEKDENGNPDLDGPRTHPEEIPFVRVRWARREGGASAGNDRILIVHDGAAVTLEIRQSMMRSDDFDELETVLRAAAPEAFAALPVPPSPRPDE